MGYGSSASEQTLDFLQQTLTKEPESDVLHRLDRMVFSAVTHPVRQAYERDASLNYHFFEGDPYTAEELADMAERGQPPTRRNEIAPIIERIVGQFIQTRQTATFLGRNTPADDQAGAIAQDYLRFVDQANMYEFEEQELVEDALVGGVGWLKIEPERNALGEMQTKMSARNPFNVFTDPYATRYNLNDDGKFVAEGPWVDLEDAICRWPKKERAMRQLAHGHGGQIELWSQVDSSLRNEALAVYVDLKRHRLRPFEVWYKRKVKLYHIFREDRIVPLAVPLDYATASALADELGPDVTMEPTYVDRMYVGVFVAGVLLHHDYSPHRTNLFPYLPLYFRRRKNGEPQSLTTRIVPINEAINKRESKSLSLLSNKQIIAEKNALMDVEKAVTELARPDGYIEVEEGALSGNAPKIIIRDNLDMGQAQMALLQEDKDAIRRVSGHGNESMGMPSEVRSGTGIARKQMMSSLIVSPFQNHLRHTRQLKARICHEYQKQYLTEEVAFQVTDDPNAARTVKVTKGHLASLKEHIYDIIITETKDWATVREQQSELLLTALPQLAQHGAWMVKLGIQLSDLRDKEGLLSMIDQQSQPAPAVPKISLAMTWQDLTPEVQAFFAMTAMQSPELAQVLMQKSDDPAFLKKLQADLANTQIKEGTRATIERGKIDYSAMATAMEGMLQARQFTQPEQEQFIGGDQDSL